MKLIARQVGTVKPKEKPYKLAIGVYPDVSLAEPDVRGRMQKRH